MKENKIAGAYKITNNITGEFYEGETLTLNALSARFRRQGIAHPYKKANEYLMIGRD